MQRLLQRVERVERVVRRQAKEADKHKAYAEQYRRDQQRKEVAKWWSHRIHSDRRDRREDWECGPLAPRRDVGDKASTYGAADLNTWQTPEREPAKRSKWLHIAEGDRVVLMRGRDRGKIGEVTDVMEEHGAVKVKDLNQIDVEIPDWLQMAGQSGDVRVQTLSQPIHLEDVRLVYPLPDPRTGKPRDVIIDRLECINRRYSRDTREWTKGDRVIPGTNTIVPWPDRSDPVYDEYDDDTRRNPYEQETFRPTLIHAPMPLSLIDELRSKYSRFRTRHDREYVLKLEERDAKAGRREALSKTMQTPLQQLAELRAERQKEQEKELTAEQLARIGEVIEQEQKKAVAAVQRVET